MFVQKQFNVCLLAALAVQVFFVTATPVKPPNDESTGEEADGSEASLETRGLFDFISNPVGAVSDSIKTVDNGLRTARTQGSRAVRSTLGSGVELATGVNPNTLYELPQEIMKKAVRGARYGTEVAYDTADKSLDTIQSLHDRKKQLLEDYVIPVAPTMVTNVIDRVNDGFDSTMAAAKNRVHAGRDTVVGKLSELEERLENGDSILPSSLQTGVNTVGKAFEAGSGWLGSLVPGVGLPGLPRIGFAPAPEDIKEVTKEVPAAKEAKEALAAEPKPTQITPPVTPGRRRVLRAPQAKSFRFSEKIN